MPDSSNPINFDAPEFSKVFNRINEYNNKQGYYNVRALNKFYAEKFEEFITCAQVDIANLRFLATSKFAQQIKSVRVQVPSHLEVLDELCYVSPTFFHNIERVDVVFNEGEPLTAKKKMTITQPLIFRGLFLHNQFAAPQRLKIYGQQQDIQIIESYFDGIGLVLSNANKVSVLNSSFRNVINTKDTGIEGLKVKRTQNIIIDHTHFFNCQYGLLVSAADKISMNKLYVKKCRQIGCVIDPSGEVNLKDSEIVDCYRGIILIDTTNGNIQNCNIDAWRVGIYVYRSTLNYRQVSIKQTEGREEDFHKIYCSYGSTVNEIF